MKRIVYLLFLVPFVGPAQPVLNTLNKYAVQNKRMSGDSNTFVNIPQASIKGLGDSISTKLIRQQSLSSESATFGAELLTSSNWTSTGWTGSYGSGFAHTAGNTTPLTRTITTDAGALYQVSWVVTGRSAGSFIISFEGNTETKVYTGSGSFGPKSLGTGGLLFTPTSDFDGTISSISVKKITAEYAPVYTLSDNTGAVNVEVRSSTASLANTFYGKKVGAFNTIGYSNVGVGNQTLASNTTGFENVSVGALSLFANTSGHNNTAIGHQALTSNTTGRNNVGVGTYAMPANTTGDFNTSIGVHSMNNSTTSSSTTALGHNALGALTTGNYNTALGENALSTNTTADQSTAVGWQTLYRATTGIGNTGLGAQSLVAVTTGGDNIGLGRLAGSNLTTGSGNTFIGGGGGITTGSYNTIIGRANSLASGMNFNVILADGAGNQRLNIDEYNRVGIGITNPTHSITLPSTSSGFVLYNTSDVTTNFERLRIYNASDEFRIEQGNGGTGVGRKIRIGSSANALYIGGNAAINKDFVLSTGGTTFNVALTGTLSASTGMQTAYANVQTINQTGSAGFRAQWISVRLQSLGSGSKYLIDAGTNTADAGAGTHTSLFNVDNVGATTSSQYKLSALNTAPASATATGTLGEIRVTATFLYVCTATNTWVRAALATW